MSGKAKEHFPVLGIKAFRPPESEADYNLLYHEIRGERHIEKPHQHDFLVFLLFEKGSGTHSIDFIDHKVTDHQVHLLFPEQVHRWDLGRKTRAHQLMISRPVFETFQDALEFSFVLYQNHPVIALAPGAFRELLYEFESIRQELRKKSIQWSIVHLRSRIIAQMISREAESAFEDITTYRAKPVLFKYHSLVNMHFREQRSVAFYADQLNISANYLNILCKRHFHVPAMFLIQHQTILEAKRLIYASEMSIKEIAFTLGFSDLAYFSNFFKSQTGVSPREFREQL